LAKLYSANVVRRLSAFIGKRSSQGVLPMRAESKLSLYVFVGCGADGFPQERRASPGIELVMTTFMAKTGEVDQKWWLVDASDKVVGRLASDIAMILMGKHRPIYTPHVDTGDFVVVVNAEKIHFSGKKWQNKRYEWYTGFTRLSSESAEKRRARRPELIIHEAVRRMMPKNKLSFKMLSKLKIYAGAEHPHQAQSPIPKDLGVK